jgi:Protein of unknown function (DUF3667)
MPSAWMPWLAWRFILARCNSLRETTSRIVMKESMHKTFSTRTEPGTPDPVWTCVTCAQDASGDFCAHCGEKRRGDHDFSLQHVLAEAAEAFFHVDSKIFLTLKVLVTKPGKLTAEFFLGRRKPYMSPLQTFFVCNLIFFVLQPLTGLEILAPSLRTYENSATFKRIAVRLVDQRLAHAHVSRTDDRQFYDFSARFYRNAHLQAKSLILVMVPMLAIVVTIFNFRRRRFFSEHLIFSLHVYAWWLLWLLANLIMVALIILFGRIFGQEITLQYLDYIATALEFGGLGVYLAFATKEFYQDNPVKAWAKGMALAFCAYGLFQLYRVLLFFTALYST